MPTIRPTRLPAARALAIAVACAAAFAAAPASSQEGEKASAPVVTDAYRDAIKAYLAAQGNVAAIGESVAYGAANETLAAIQASGTPVTEPMQQIVLEEALASYGKRFGDVDTLARLWAPVYVRHFSIDEIQQMTDFFKSPVGRKSIELLPVINQDGMRALQEESFAMTPEFQLAVDARFRQAGIAGETPKAPPGN